MYIQCNNIFSDIPVYWWIAVGWALDLHLDRITREHEDIDIVILRSEHLLLSKVFV
ncbi:nucleotidyltransferase domain-containing protein [Fictibacillus halophilus]|uniref:nucleotidyltransferase domain-containing protein n=1 Tax=Fictibacillus halophilus TaxID=1610490 RepID=UPI0036263CE7